jgi:hypothetical protein
MSRSSVGTTGWMSSLLQRFMYRFRKQKFLSLDKPMTLFSVRSDLTQALWCPGEDIKNSPIEVKSNKFVSEEKFYVVPIEKWRRVCLP